MMGEREGERRTIKTAQKPLPPPPPPLPPPSSSHSIDVVGWG